jgi:hypothetical protein
VELAGSRDAEVRRRVAHRPTCPLPALTTLARDPDPWVRGAVGENPSTPPDAGATSGGHLRAPGVPVPIRACTRPTPEALAVASALGYTLPARLPLSAAA